MSETFNSVTIDALAKRLQEPSWMTELRHAALTKHGHLPWPHPSDDVWRRTKVSLLDPMRGFAPIHPELLQAVALKGSQVAGLITPLGGEQLLVRVNGAWLTEGMPNGLTIKDLTEAAQDHPELIRKVVEADGFTDAEQKLLTLNTAFHHDGLFVQVPSGYSGMQPLRLVHLVSVAAQQAIFPMTLITVGAGSSVTLIDEYVSLDPDASNSPHLVNGRIELVIEPDASVHYVRLQRWGDQAREFLLQRATLGKGASLTMANINLGAVSRQSRRKTAGTPERVLRSSPRATSHGSEGTEIRRPL